MQITYKPLIQETILEAMPLLRMQDAELLQKKQKRGFAVIYGRVVVGVLLYVIQEAYLVIDRIAVSPQYQHYGIGTEMLNTICRFAESSQHELVFSFTAENRQDSFYRFISATGLFYIEQQAGFEAILEEEDLRELRRKYLQGHEERTCFFDLSSRMREEFLTQAAEVYPKIVEEIRKAPETFSRKLCCCSVANQRIQAACFVQEIDGKRELRLLFSLPERGVLAAKALLQSISQLEPEDLVPLSVSPTNASAVKIMEGLCPSYHIQKRIYMAYYMGKSEARR